MPAPLQRGMHLLSSYSLGSPCYDTPHAGSSAERHALVILVLAWVTLLRHTTCRLRCREECTCYPRTRLGHLVTTHHMPAPLQRGMHLLSSYSLGSPCYDTPHAGSTAERNALVNLVLAWVTLLRHTTCRLRCREECTCYPRTRLGHLVTTHHMPALLQRGMHLLSSYSLGSPCYDTPHAGSAAERHALVILVLAWVTLLRHTTCRLCCREACTCYPRTRLGHLVTTHHMPAPLQRGMSNSNTAARDAAKRSSTRMRGTRGSIDMGRKRKQVGCQDSPKAERQSAAKSLFSGAHSILRKRILHTWVRRGRCDMLRMAKASCEGASLVSQAAARSACQRETTSVFLLTTSHHKRLAGQGEWVFLRHLPPACRDSRVVQGVSLVTQGLVVRSKTASDMAVSLLASHQGDPGSIPGRVTPDFRMWESCRTIPLVGGSSRGSPVSPAPSFRLCSVLTSITLIGSQGLAVKSRPNLFTHSPFISLGSPPLWCGRNALPFGKFCVEWRVPRCGVVEMPCLSGSFVLSGESPAVSHPLWCGRNALPFGKFCVEWRVTRCGVVEMPCLSGSFVLSGESPAVLLEIARFRTKPGHLTCRRYLLFPSLATTTSLDEGGRGTIHSRGITDNMVRGGGPTARTFVSHQGDLGLIPSGVTRILACGNRTRTMPFVSHQGDLGLIHSGVTRILACGNRTRTMPFVSHQGDLGLIHSGVTRILACGNRTRTMPLVDRFPGAVPFPLHVSLYLGKDDSECHFKTSPVPNENSSFRWFSPLPLPLSGRHNPSFTDHDFCFRQRYKVRDANPLSSTNGYFSATSYLPPFYPVTSHSAPGCGNANYSVRALESEGLERGPTRRENILLLPSWCRTLDCSGTYWATPRTARHSSQSSGVSSDNSLANSVLGPPVIQSPWMFLVPVLLFRVPPQPTANHSTPERWQGNLSANHITPTGGEGGGCVQLVIPLPRTLPQRLDYSSSSVNSEARRSMTAVVPCLGLLPPPDARQTCSSATCQFCP
ncbi:hypothetical protein PR048_033145 [Dryococelus australis]|uniref:Uncharacterized protein n=1 Tax=Dryococelus australis TaxID=614101 RepID=A0ABQ9FZF5_9NEOP|nr:hypothetical protein PR048_033145 [Dryococelus australis]